MGARTAARQLSAGAVVVYRQQGDWRYLLLRVFHYWDFPKGLVEPGETPLQAAIREIEEETTLHELTFPWGHVCYETPPYGRGKVARYYLARSLTTDVHLPVNPEIGRPEHHEYRWLDAQTARGLLGKRLVPVLDWARSLIESSSG